VLQSLDYGRAIEEEIEEEEEEFDPPDGLEEEIDALMGSLSDKVSPRPFSASTHAHPSVGHHRPLLCRQIPLPPGRPSATQPLIPNRRIHYRALCGYGAGSFGADG
jgi:hypothetical protein